MLKVLLQQQKAHNDPFPFLKLPPELRNLVYDFAALHTGEPKAGHPSDQHSVNHWKSLKSAVDGRCFPHPLSLTCRLIRSEFLPLHTASLRLAFSFDEKLRFFVNHLRTASLYPGHIIIYVDGGYAQKSLTADLIPLLNVQKSRKGVQCEFRPRLVKEIFDFGTRFQMENRRNSIAGFLNGFICHDHLVYDVQRGRIRHVFVNTNIPMHVSVTYAAETRQDHPEDVINLTEGLLKNLARHNNMDIQLIRNVRVY